MRIQKKPVKKERNYSIWFTGIVLILAYMILLDGMSEKGEYGIKNILLSQAQVLQEHMPEIGQE